MITKHQAFDGRRFRYALLFGLVGLIDQVVAVAVADDGER